MTAKEQLINKITERMNLIPDDPIPSERAAYDAYLNTLNWANEILEEYTSNPLSVVSEEEINVLALDFHRTANKQEIIFDLGWMKIFAAGFKASQSIQQASRRFTEEESKS